MRKWVSYWLLSFLSLSIMTTTPLQAAQFSLFGGYEFSSYGIETSQSNVSTNLHGWRLGLGTTLPISPLAGLLLSLSTGNSNGKNSASSTLLSETYSSWDIKPSLYFYFSHLYIGTSFRYEMLSVATTTNSMTQTGKYTGIEWGPSLRYKLFGIGDTISFVLGTEYLFGKLSHNKASMLNGLVLMAFHI